METEQNCNILISPAPPDIAVCRSRSPGLLNLGPEGPASLGHVLIPASSHQLVWSPNSLGIPGAPSAGWWLSLPHLVSNVSDLQLTDFNRPLNLWNGMFDRHQAEITVMQFTGHSLPVHLSMTVLRDSTLSHIVSQARLRDFFL